MRCIVKKEDLYPYGLQILFLCNKSFSTAKSGFLRGGGLGEGPSFSGADCLTHGEKNKADVDKYGKQAMEKTILDTISVTDVGPEAE